MFRVCCNLIFNWYIVSDGLELRIIVNIVGEDFGFVFFFDKFIWDEFSIVYVVDFGYVLYMVIFIFKEFFIIDKMRKVLVGEEWWVYGEKGLENEVYFLVSKRDFCLL